MLSVTIQVTRNSTTLEQIHHLAIQNQGVVADGCLYKVWLDGQDMGAVVHEPDDGALVLVGKALSMMERKS